MGKFNLRKWEKAFCKVHDMHDKNTKYAIKIFNAFDNKKITVRMFNCFLWLYSEHHCSLPFNEGYYGNLLTLSLDLNKWDIAKHIINNSNNFNISYCSYYDGAYGNVFDYMEYLKNKVSDHDKPILNELLNTLKERNHILIKQKQ